MHTDVHVHVNDDAWLQYALEETKDNIGFPGDRMAADGGGSIREVVDGLGGDNVKVCGGTGGGGGCCEVEDDGNGDDIAGCGEDRGNDSADDEAARYVLCADEGAGGCIAEEALEVAFLMMSAACLIVSNCTAGQAFQLPTFSATPYTTACRWLAGMTGMIEASTILRF